MFGPTIQRRALRAAFPVVACRATILVAALCAVPALGAQERIDAAAVARIKQEGFARSQVMDLASWLTDVHGPRLTNSPQSRAAAAYAIEKLRGWGMRNPHLETFPFGRGWSNERMVAQVVAPVPYPVLAFPGAWTVGTNGPVTGEVMVVDIPNGAGADSAYARYRGKLRGKIVLAGAPPTVTPQFTPPATRLTEQQLEALANVAVVPASPQQNQQRGPGNNAQPQRPAGPTPAEARAKFWVDEGVLAVLTPGASRGNTGSVSNGPTGNRQPGAPPSVPQLSVSAEHYGRMYRQLEKGVPVRMELDVRNRFHDADLDAFNIVAEIPGTDPRLEDEVVMIGAHFDSWHNASGATDNGGSSAIMLEALRILKASGVPLRRTVRIALWTGEEQGLIGSGQYVRAHFGTAQAPTPANRKVSAYFNLDNGAGAIRGIYTQGNEAVRPIFAEWLKAIDSDSITARTVTINSTGSTDHVSFDRVGIPGFQFIQDPMDYGTRTHHSSQDFFERLVAADMRHNAVAVATFAFLAANRDAPLPRKAMVQ
jgi:carboxypeptidase Q